METAHQLRCVRDWKWLWNLHSLQEEASSNVPGCGVSSAKAAVATGARNFLSKNTEKQWAYELETASFVLGTGPKMGLQYLGYCRTIWCPLCTAKSLVPVLEFQELTWVATTNMSWSKAKQLHWPFGSCDKTRTSQANHSHSATVPLPTPSVLVVATCWYVTINCQ